MSALIELLELLNNCSPERASAYMFFITVFSYVIISTLSDSITDVIFVLKGYKKPKKKDDETPKQVL